jgi:hypothetical protein
MQGLWLIWESPPAPSSASSPAPSVVVVVVLGVGKSLDNGIQDDETKDVRPERIENDQCKCSDEQPDHPILVMVRVKHQSCCVSTASLSPSTPNSCSPQSREPQKQAKGQRCGSLAAFVLAGQLFPGRLKILLPSR